MTIFWKSQIVDSKDGIAKRIKIAAMLFTPRERWRASDSALSKVRSKVLRLTLDALTQKLSDVCNVGVK
jgi:hypothetical protein